MDELLMEKVKGGSLSCLLTVTLKPKLYKFQAITQYELTKHELLSILVSVGGCRAFTATELTETGNIHYHTVAVFKDKYASCTLYNKLKKNRLFGFIHIKPIRSEQEFERAWAYLLKDVDTTRKVLRRNGWNPDITFWDTLPE